MRAIKQKTEWSRADNARLIQMMEKGWTFPQIAMSLGRSENAVKEHFKHLASLNERLREQSEDTSGKYIIKMTDFDTSIVVTYMEVDIKFFGNSTKAWNYTMGVIRAENLKARSNGLKQFYWVRYK